MNIDADSAQQIFRAQVTAIYDHTLANLLPAFIISSLVVLAIWNNKYAYELLSWLALNFAFIAIRLYSYRQFSREEKTEQRQYISWANKSFYIQLAYGLLWAALPIFYTDLSTTPASTLLAIYFFAITGMIGFTISHYSFFSMWLAFVIPTTGAMCYVLFSSPVDDTNMMAVYLFLFNFFLFSMMNRNHKSLQETTLLKNEYAHLMTRLKVEKDKAERANLNKSKFLASASHDLRQPIHAMNLFIEMLQKQSLAADVSNLITRIANSANNLHSLFNSLLDISRLDAGTIDINVVPVKLDRICEEVIEVYTPDAQAKELTIASDLNEQFILTDPVYLTRIISNLINNAVNNTESGKITLLSEACDDQVRITIEDTGKGIPADDLERIFDEFKQLDNPERDRNKGLGLGLAICKRLATLLGTRIEVSSQLGKGSKFSILVPKSNQQEYNAHQEPAELSQNHLGASDLAPYSIMIIDDEQDILDAMPLILASWGCQEIAAVSSDQEAMQAMDDEFYPDLVISDYRLRDNLTGLDVLRQISNRLGYPVRAILISGDTAPESLTSMKDSGLTLLHKPIHSKQLEQAVIKALL